MESDYGKVERNHRGLPQLLSRRFLLLLLTLLCSAGTSFHAAAREWMLLSSNRSDVLLNTRTGEVRGLSVPKVNLPKTGDPAVGVFTDGTTIWWMTASEVIDLVTGRKIPLPAGHLYPIQRYLGSFQGARTDRHLAVPVQNGFVLIDLSSGMGIEVPYGFSPEEDQGISLPLPKLINGREGIFALENSKIRIFRKGAWKTCLKTEMEPVLDTRVVWGSRWITLVLSKLRPGDLDSFTIRTVCIDRRDGTVSLDHTDPGILKQAYADAQGRPVVEYVSASIMSALFQRDQLKYRKYDPETGQVKDHSVTMSHKRRHVFPIPDQNRDLILVIHCKDGDVYQLNTNTGKLNRIAKEVAYDHQLARTGRTLQIVDHDMRPVGVLALQLSP